jgi:hypothetical protein
MWKAFRSRQGIVGRKYGNNAIEFFTVAYDRCRPIVRSQHECGPVASDRNSIGQETWSDEAGRLRAAPFEANTRCKIVVGEDNVLRPLGH